MNIQVCCRSAGIGVLIGTTAIAAAWYGTTLRNNAAITQALLASARCDTSGFVSITFTDASQFTCVPAQQMPPTSPQEAARRKKAQP